MTWVSHVGRLSSFVDATPTHVREVAGDIRRAGAFVRGHLDAAHSDLDGDPVVWALQPVGVVGLKVRPAIEPVLEHVPAGLLLHAAPVAGFDPTRLAAHVDLVDEADGCRVVVRWDAAVDIAVPRLARKPAAAVVGHVVSGLAHELVEQVRVALR